MTSDLGGSQMTRKKSIGRMAFLCTVGLALVAATPSGLGLILVDFVPRNMGHPGLDGAISVALSPDGTSVYVAGKDANGLITFSRDTEGNLIDLGSTINNGSSIHGLLGAHSVVVSPNGKHVYVASAVDDAVAFLSRNTSTGVLTFREAEYDGDGLIDGLNTAICVTVSPDGNHIYVVGFNDNAIAIFSRDHITGFMAFEDVVKNTDPGVEGLAQVYSVVVSPDNKHVYTAANTDDAVAVFSRSSSTGALSLVEVEKDGVGGVDGLWGATDVAVSPDGQYVYAVGSRDSSLVVFARDAATGELTFLTSYKDGVNGIDGLGGAISVAVSPHGRHVFVACYADDALVAFARAPGSGMLEFSDLRRDNVNPGGGVLDSAQAVTVSPDSIHVYVAATEADVLTEWKVTDLGFFEAEPPNDLLPSVQGGRR